MTEQRYRICSFPEKKIYIFKCGFGIALPSMLLNLFWLFFRTVGTYFVVDFGTTSVLVRKFMLWHILSLHWIKVKGSRWYMFWHIKYIVEKVNAHREMFALFLIELNIMSDLNHMASSDWASGFDKPLSLSLQLYCCYFGHVYFYGSNNTYNSFLIM